MSPHYAALVNISLIYIYCHNVGHEHIVTAERNDFCDAAFYAHGALGDGGTANLKGILASEAAGGEFVGIAPARDAAVVDRTDYMRARQIDNELSRLANDPVGVPFGTE